MNIQNKKKLEEILWVKTYISRDEQILWEKAKKYKKIFQYLPWVQCICVCNSLAMNAASKKSDIDLFIITKTQRLWTTRIALTAILVLFGQRKTKYKHAWKFCLSFFISNDSLDISSIALDNDFYLEYWVETLIPIVNKNHTFENFINSNSHWTGMKHFDFEELSTQKKNVWLWETLWNNVEFYIKKIFLPKTKKSFQNIWKPFGVIIGESMLKFHNKDQRKIIRDEILK